MRAHVYSVLRVDRSPVGDPRDDDEGVAPTGVVGIWGVLTRNQILKNILRIYINIKGFQFLILI